MPYFYFYPISPNRILILVSNLIALAPNYIFGFDKKIFKLPSYCGSTNVSRHKVSKIYEGDVRKINAIIAHESTEGFILHDEEHVSVDRFEEEYANWEQNNGSAWI